MLYKPIIMTSSVQMKPRKGTIVEPPPVITREDFEQYNKLLLKLDAGPGQKVNFKGEMHNINWLQYNLFQYCLPPKDRKFFEDEKQYHLVMNHNVILQVIELFFLQNNFGR